MKLKVLYFVIAFLIILCAGFLLGRNTATAPTKEVAPTSEVSSIVSPSSSPPSTSSATTTQVKIFLVAVYDEGKSGTKFGCGDSIVPVIQNIAPTTMPLTAALTQLLSIKTQYYGQSGLYNALHQSSLTVSKATVINGVATVYLTGKLQLGGVCDDPRAEMQFTQTVMQFPTVKVANIYINNIPLHEAVSEK